MESSSAEDDDQQNRRLYYVTNIRVSIDKKKDREKVPPALALAQVILV